jgi:hypothetical protein
MTFCELCEDVNNFSGKCLPAIAIREKKLSSSTLTGSRARWEIVPILPAAGASICLKAAKRFAKASSRIFYFRQGRQNVAQLFPKCHAGPVRLV